MRTDEKDVKSRRMEGKKNCLNIGFDLSEDVYRIVKFLHQICTADNSDQVSVSPPTLHSEI